MSDCCHDSEARAAEDLDMKKGEILRVYRATKGQFTDSLLSRV